MNNSKQKKLLRWFYPGRHVKRFLLLSALGVIIASLALAVFVILATMSIDKGQVAFLLQDLSRYIPRYLVIIGSVLLFTLGIYFIILGVQLVLKNIFGTITTADLGEMADGIYKKQLLAQGPQIVVIGGGTGLSTLLRGLKGYTSNITAIVTAADDGGSSGRIRKEWGLVPPGDIRNCLLALAETEPLMNALFDYRFVNGEGLEGHNFGNLFILAMSEVTGDFETAVQEFSRVLKVRGQVVASTLDNINLKAILANGEEIIGESNITKKGEKISKVQLVPNTCSPNPSALKAIEKAELIVLGPGSLYTSIMPNLLVPGMVEAIQNSKAPVIYVVNVMSEPGETTGFTASDHLKAILDHINCNRLIDYVLVNTDIFDEDIRKRYQKEGAFPVEIDLKKLEAMGVQVVQASLANSLDFARHDPEKLASAIMGILARLKLRRFKNILH